MRAPKRIGYKELVEAFPGFDNPENLISIPLAPRRRYGQVDFNELAIIAAITHAVKPEVIFEFGTFDGLTTLCLSKAAPKSHIYTLDLPDDQLVTRLPSDEADYASDAPIVARSRWKIAKADVRITEIRMDSADFNPASYNDGKLIGNTHLIFIDANHAYSYVRRDTEESLRMLSPNGILIWHDYFKRSFPGVTAFLAEFAESHDVYWVEHPDPPDYLETSLCFFGSDINI